MAGQQDPKWEVVDELPGERKPRPPSAARRFLTSKPLWLGVIAGGILVALFPPFMVALISLIRRLAMSWWLWLPLGLYWLWLRNRRRQRR